MSEIDVMQSILAGAQGIPAMVSGTLVGLAACWVYLKKFHKTAVKEDVETTTYELLVEDNERLSKLVKSMGEEIQALKRIYSLDRESMQKQMFLERQACFEEMQELRLKVETLERAVRNYESSNTRLN